MSPTTVKTVLLVFLILAPLFVAETLPRARAAEMFTLTPTPSRTQEGDPAGVTLVLSVSNALNTVYSFLWTVTDPSGGSRSTSQSTVSASSSWSLSVKYPGNFTGASINLVGFYKVNVTETSPAVVAGVATGQFQIGLTDSSSYQRTFPVQVRAAGYFPADTVTVSLSQGSNPVPGFPTSRQADTGGVVSFTWMTLPGTPQGNYTISLSGATTPVKNPPDSQQFTVSTANVTVGRLWTSTSSVQRSQSLELRFNASYLSGLVVSTGSCLVRVQEPGGGMSYTVIASYDTSRKTFRAYYATTLGSKTGSWSWNLDVNSFNDGLGNTGPLSPMSSSFNVQPASLAVVLSSYSGTYSSGTTIPVYATVVTPGGGNFTVGTVNATITLSGRRVVGPLSLVYDQSQGRWSGSYKVNSTDPSGTWLVTVNAGDSYGNYGASAASVNVNTPGSAPAWFLTWNFWLLVLVGIGVGVGILMLRVKGVSHREVRLDVQAIKQQADKVKGDDFLQSISAQLKRRTERMAAEKQKE